MGRNHRDSRKDRSSKGKQTKGAGSKLNRQHKDAVFRITFGDYPENALALYNAINHTAYTDPDELEIVTLKDALYVGMRNDLGFIFQNDLNLYEHQSTYCPNMPMRGLWYIADLLRKLYAGSSEDEKKVYSSVLVTIPTPHFYVFYNGLDEIPETEELRLSDAYEGIGDIEVVAHMININKGHSEELMSTCKPLQDYSELVFRMRKYAEEGYVPQEAARLAIDSCIADGIMPELLRKERARMVRYLGDMTTELTDVIVRMRVKEITEQLKKELTERVTNEVTERVTNEVTEKVTNEVTEKVTNEVTNQLTAEFKKEYGSKQTGLVDKLVAEKGFSMEEACEFVGISIADYENIRAEV